MTAVHVIVKGKVQGVFYRVSAKEKAETLGIYGWVKNTKEGHVEMHAQGSEKKIEEFIEWCKQGPSRAHVESVETTDADEQPFRDFKVQHN